MEPADAPGTAHGEGDDAQPEECDGQHDPAEQGDEDEGCTHRGERRADGEEREFGPRPLEERLPDDRARRRPDLLLAARARDGGQDLLEAAVDPDATIFHLDLHHASRRARSMVPMTRTRMQ